MLNPKPEQFFSVFITFFTKYIFWQKKRDNDRQSDKKIFVKKLIDTEKNCSRFGLNTISYMFWPNFNFVRLSVCREELLEWFLKPFLKK